MTKDERNFMEIILEENKVFKMQIDQLRSEKLVIENKYDNLEKEHKQLGESLGFLTICIVIAIGFSLSIGYYFGKKNKI